jgi:hypothetical protein
MQLSENLLDSVQIMILTNDNAELFLVIFISMLPREYKLRSYLIEKYRLLSTKPRVRPLGSVTLTTWHPLSAKVGNQFADKRRSLTDSDHGVYAIIISKKKKIFPDLHYYLKLRAILHYTYSNFRAQTFI